MPTGRDKDQTNNPPLHFTSPHSALQTLKLFIQIKDLQEPMLVKLLLYFMHLGALMLIVLQTSVDVWDAKKFSCPQKCRNSLALNFTRTLRSSFYLHGVSS